MSTNKGKDRQFTAKLQQTIAASAQQLKQTAFVCKPHEEVLKDILQQFVKVDFKARADFDPDDEDAKLKKEHYLVIIVEEIQEVTTRNKCGICRREAFFYIYNGAYWRLLDKDELKALLRTAAEKMGVDKFKARYVEFSKDLFEQFNETAYLPAPTVNREMVLINLQNGTFEISGNHQQLRAPQSADFLNYQLPFAYDPTATAPLFTAFLDRVLPDPDCQRVLAEFLGYIFVSPAKLKLEKALLLYGSGANGKSVVFEVITALLGSENVSHCSLQSLTDEKGYHRAQLANKRVNYASEISSKLESNIFKQLASGEPIEARLPYGQPFILKDYAKLIFNCNELPTDVEHTNAYFRRFIILPFSVTITEHEQDKQLATKIIESELSGVFNWILAGLRRLLEQNRFTDAVAVRQQIDLYKRQSDSVRLFLDENEYKPDGERHTPLKDLYRDYKGFCIDDGYKPVNNRNFQKRLNANGVLTERKNTGYVAYTRKSDTPY